MALMAREPYDTRKTVAAKLRVMAAEADLLLTYASQGDALFDYLWRLRASLLGRADRLEKEILSHPVRVPEAR
jgi:hypothetical protein